MSIKVVVTVTDAVTAEGALSRVTRALSRDGARYPVEALSRFAARTRERRKRKRKATQELSHPIEERASAV